MGRHLRLFLLLAALLACARLIPAAVDAHGTLDQSLSGDPGCLASVLRATAPSSGTLRQEFVPSAVGTGVQSVDVCLALTSTSNVILNIRSGTVASPGSVVGTASATGVLSGTRWVHFEMPALVPTTSGATYLLELSGFPLFSWRGTCGQVAGACTTLDSDLYPAGVSSATPAVLDFGFRTYASTDTDGDGISDPIDNCPNDANADQANHDGNFIDQTPPSTADDTTWINADAAGDACDTDDDNDGMLDTDELALPGAPCASASAQLSPILADSDGDRYFDGAECALGTDPASAGSKPTAAQCYGYLGVGGSTDTDGDGLKDYVEFCNYNSDRTNVNTDGDVCADGKEAASINGDNNVNSGDQLLLLNEMLRTPPPPKLVNMDSNKDGALNAGDQLFLVLRFGPC